VLGAALQIVAQALRAWQTPYPLFVVTFWLTSVGQAFQDTHANSYVAGASKGAHRWLGFIHAMYMAGCLVAPFAASPIASAKSPSVWYLFYTVPAGLGAINLVMCLLAFRNAFRLKGKPESSSTSEDSQDGQTSESQHKTAGQLIKRTLKQSSLWYISVFFFFYLGMTLTASGWVVEYLVDVRDGDLERVSYVPAGFSGGCLLGRLLLPEPTHKYGERLMGTIYLTICLGVQLVFWLYVDLTPFKRRITDQEIQSSEHHRCINCDQRLWVLFWSSLCCCKSCNYAINAQAYTCSGNVCGIEIVLLRDEINRTLYGLRLCADGRISLSYHHWAAQHQDWCLGVAARSCVADCSYPGLLVHHPQAQRFRK